MKSFEERLRGESADWVSEGVITADQRGALLARHSDTSAAGRFAAILGIIGGGLLLAGVCLLIGNNWQEIGDWAKIIGLVALLAGAYFAGWKLKIEPGRYPKTGDAFFMLGAGLFMAGIALVSQIFHLNSRPPSGVLLWWLGIVAVPWLVRAKGAQVVSLFALLAWLAMEFNLRGGWLELRPDTRFFDDEMRVFAMMTALGLAVWLAGLALRGTKHEDFSGLHEKWGAMIVCTGLYALGFLKHAWEWHDGDAPVRLLPVLVVAALVALAGWGAWRTSRREVVALGGSFVLALVPVGVVLLGASVGDGGWLWSACAWTGLFVLNVFMIRSGLANGREGWVNLGLGFIALNIVTRYFDLFGTMLEGGVFFLVSGVIVLVLGFYLERKRRGWLATMRAEKEVA
ncbi:hypothetical protein IMCC26134_05705 [Verrucomicrobia bacterium IMCC26134]|nr:hypothetical protein IMCC26134_05705 [Verrucomicrobia bacterium IMCC26134]